MHICFQANRWKKKGLALTPIKWGVDVASSLFTCLVNIHGGDGSVLVNHGGVEMGQGINTKVRISINIQNCV